jgi:hypothetical protein
MITPNEKIIALLIFTTVINFYTPVPYLGFNFSGQHSTVNRLSMATFAALVIGLTDIYIHFDDYPTHTLVIWTFVFILFISILYYVIEKQIFVSEHEYLLTMKENHIMDLHITQSILNHENLDDHGKKYGSKILSNREHEISLIDNILKKNTPSSEIKNI